MNELRYAKECVDNTRGGTDFQTLTIIASYYYSLGYTDKDVYRMLEDYVLRRQPTVSVSLIANELNACVAKGKTTQLLSVDEIPISAQELQIINEMSLKNWGVRGRRFAFTALCLAKYKNLKNAKNNSWVSYPLKDIYALSNVTLTKTNQSVLIGDLARAGYLQLSNIITSISFRVLYECAGDVAMQVTDMRNLGNQYMCLFNSEDYLPCTECGIVIRRKTNNQKYCNACASRINNAKTLERRRNKL